MMRSLVSACLLLLGLANAASAWEARYVPAPRPVATDPLVGAYYFPGWNTASRWQPLRAFPERRPVLGYYREGDPEVMDWQIKWAVEHGISFFAFDWYWVQGGRQLEHALHDGYFHARYRRLLKFCLLWANHNPPNSSSEEDLLNVTRFWIDHYFRRDEYLRVDGKPVVILFSPGRLTADMGAPRVKAAFAKMRALCREAGLGGLYLVACANDDASALQQLKEESYDAVTGYNWPGAGMKPEEGGTPSSAQKRRLRGTPIRAGRRAPYATLISGYARMWRHIIDAGALPLLPPLSAGWDSRPWHGDEALVRYGMTPRLFRRHLEAARRLCETSPRSQVLNLVLIEAWNEWGEGSFIEPHAQFGFGYLDAIRAVFARAPRKHVDVTPMDVGLGPYDLPPLRLQTAWEFNTDGDLEGWDATMMMTDVQVKGGCLRGTTTGNDPAFFGPPMRAKASAFPVVDIRMRISKSDTAQLFWSTPTSAESEANSVRFEVTGDGAFHDYRLDLSRHPRWRGTITGLRLDPANQRGVEVEVDAIRLSRAEAAR
jgi:glycosyl transferase family WbsX